MLLFWKKGYTATSVSDLTDAMGISRSSLYQAFGNKDELFGAVLERYAAGELHRLTAVLAESQDGLASIEAFLENLVSWLAAPHGRHGCLVTNTAAERGAGTPAVRARVADLVGSLEHAFGACLIEARAAGELAPVADVGALARHLTAVALGLQVLAKTEPDERYLRDVAAVAMASLRRRA
ncbi:MAG: TetR/AcrR family transcriptional regulator [Solirubrobacteraceae bacterium]